MCVFESTAGTFGLTSRSYSLTNVPLASFVNAQMSPGRSELQEPRGWTQCRQGRKLLEESCPRTDVSSHLLPKFVLSPRTKIIYVITG